MIGPVGTAKKRGGIRAKSGAGIAGAGGIARAETAARNKGTALGRIIKIGIGTEARSGKGGEMTSARDALTGIVANAATETERDALTGMMAEISTETERHRPKYHTQRYPPLTSPSTAAQS